MPADGGPAPLKFPDMLHDRILILDFGSQVTQLIARRVREAHVYCEVHPNDVSADFIREFNPKGIILSGSHMSAYEESNDQVSPAVFSAGVPVLGICYGMQTMAQQLGGRVESGSKREFGYAEVRAHNHTKLLEGIEDFKGPEGEGMLKVWMSHGDKVTVMPEGFKLMCSTPSCPIAGMADETRGFYAVQFHPEVTHTVQGSLMLKRFVTDICHCKPDWVMGDYIAEAVEMIRKQTNGEEVILGLSGGVDSSVAAALIHRAIGDKLTCVFVDNGLLRKGEPEQVVQVFRDEMDANLIYVDAVDRFLDKLAGVADPEQKRKIIGAEFIRVFEDEARKIGKVDYLVQGTIYPDRIESLNITGKTIKSHHNVGGLPEEMHLQLCEPLKWLFKDEVRRVGRQMGMPEHLITRHPFPGPGLAVRILGDITPEKVRVLQDADDIFIQGLRDWGLYDQVWQAGVILLPVKSVGVMGDERTYERAVALRAVTSTDAMTADWAHLPYDFMAKVSNDIINKVKGVNRVCYDISSKPPSTIEWE